MKVIIQWLIGVSILVAVWFVLDRYVFQDIHDVDYYIAVVAAYSVGFATKAWIIDLSK